MSDGEQAEDSQKTEEPTPKKLEEARKRGQVAVSREASNWLMLVAGTILIAAAAGPILSELQQIMKAYIEHAHDMPGVPGGFNVILGGAFKKIALLLMLPFLALMAAAFLGPFLQVGPLFAPEVIKPDISKISPLKGFSRLFSMRSLVEFFKGILKIVIVAVVGFFILYPYYGQVDHMVGLPLDALLDEMQELIVKLLTGIVVVMMAVAVIDIAYQRQEHHKKMRMTRHELKEEYRQTEGDPHVKARLRQLRTERARKRMMQAVPEADVVITNPTHYSIALKYDSKEMEAPKCVAKGMDHIALRIREVAKEHGVEIVENPPLARTLYDVVELDEIIPTEHYKAVAEVISYVFRKQGKLKPKPT
jgi:flagellar biosynthetic protein FlhB